MDFVGILSVLLFVLYLRLYVAADSETFKLEIAREKQFEDCEKQHIEPGCDCKRTSCNSNCCDVTCKLFSNATCAAGLCCDLETCQLKKIATLCRRPETACDLPEFCDGQSERCPSNVYKSNSEKCQNGQNGGHELFCNRDQCISKRTHHEQTMQCPNNCSGNGVCNDRGHCHCNVGFSGESCLEYGPGGSLDSGPATHPHIFNGFPRFGYIIFCAALPIVVLLNFLVCIFCQKMNTCNTWSKEPRKYRPSNASQAQRSKAVSSIYVEKLR